MKVSLACKRSSFDSVVMEFWTWPKKTFGSTLVVCFCLGGVLVLLSLSVPTCYDMAMCRPLTLLSVSLCLLCVRVEPNNMFIMLQITSCPHLSPSSDHHSAAVPTALSFLQPEADECWQLVLSPPDWLSELFIWTLKRLPPSSLGWILQWRKTSREYPPCHPLWMFMPFYALRFSEWTKLSSATVPVLSDGFFWWLKPVCTGSSRNIFRYKYHTWNRLQTFNLLKKL